MTVLELYRQGDITNCRDAVRYLVARGVPYYTLFCPDHKDRITYIRPEVPTLSWWISGTVLNRYDYQVYEQRAYNILARPRGRAALAQGGIVWRLASEIMSADWHDAVFEGPSTDVYHTGQPFRPCRGDDYYDDALTLEELDVVCGVHKIFTGRANQYTHSFSLLTSLQMCRSIRRKTFRGG